MERSFEMAKGLYNQYKPVMGLFSIYSFLQLSNLKLNIEGHSRLAFKLLDWDKCIWHKMKKVKT